MKLENKSLLGTWVFLVALTIASLFSGNIYSDHFGFANVIVLLILMGIKARQILYIFLNLRDSTTVWRVAFLTYLIIMSLITILPNAVLWVTQSGSAT